MGKNRKDGNGIKFIPLNIPEAGSFDWRIYHQPFNIAWNWILTHQVNIQRTSKTSNSANPWYKSNLGFVYSDFPKMFQLSSLCFAGDENDVAKPYEPFVKQLKENTEFMSKYMYNLFSNIFYSTVILSCINKTRQMRGTGLWKFGSNPIIFLKLRLIKHECHLWRYHARLSPICSVYY